AHGPGRAATARSRAPAPESSYAFARDRGIWRAGGLAVRPFAGEPRIHDVVAEGACEQHRLAQRALALKAQSLCQRPAALVFHVQANLDAIEPPLAEGELEQRAHGRGHRASALRALREPVADARVAVAPVHAVESDHPHDAPAAHDRRLKAV